MTTKARMTRSAVLTGATAAELEDNINDWLAEAGERRIYFIVPAGELTVAIFFAEG